LSALVEVLDVSLSEVDSEQLHGRGLESPSSGDVSETYALDVEGWVLGRRPIEKVRFVHNGNVVWRTPVRKDGKSFRTAIGTLRLPPEFELLMSAPLGDGQVADVARIRGRRDRLGLDTEPRIQPLVVSSLGRSGSTAVTRMLEALPSVISYGTYRREPSVAAYWMGVLTALAEPASYRSQMIQAVTLGNWWLGGEVAPQPFDPEPVQQLIGVDAIRSLAAFCGSRIAAFYEPLAEDHGGAEGRYFIEKYPPARVPEVMWDLYPGAREIIVIRDFRDMAASMLAFGSKKGPIRTDFGRHADRSDADFIRRLGETVSVLDGYRQQRRDNALVLRYEDLVQRPEEVIPALLRYLNLEASREHVTSVHEAFLARSEMADAHRTTTDLEASIGRWQRDFDADVRDVCQEAFGPALAAFGYAD
jgi:sulfotransferase family protein